MHALINIIHRNGLIYVLVNELMYTYYITIGTGTDGLPNNVQFQTATKYVVLKRYLSMHVETLLTWTSTT